MEQEDGDRGERLERQERTGVQVAFPPWGGGAEPASHPAAQLVRMCGSSPTPSRLTNCGRELP